MSSLSSLSSLSRPSNHASNHHSRYRSCEHARCDSCNSQSDKLRMPKRPREASDRDVKRPCQNICDQCAISSRLTKPHNSCWVSSKTGRRENQFHLSKTSHAAPLSQLVRTLEKRTDAEFTLALRSLLLVATAFRPPSKLEFCEAASGRLSTHSHDQEVAESGNESSHEDYAFQVCEGLLRITERDTVVFLDQEMRHFIASTDFQRRFRFPSGHELWTTITIQLLQYESRTRIDAASEFEPLQQERGNSHLQDYATRFWSDHYRKLEGRSQAANSLLHQSILSKVTRGVAPTGLWERQYNRGLVAGLQIAAIHNFPRIGRAYLEMGAQVQPCAHLSQSPLIAAASNSSAEMVAILLEYGADANAVSGSRSRSQACIVAHDSGPCLNPLLSCQRKSSYQHYWCCCDCGQGQTPLQFAASHGRSDILRLLISAGADLNATTPITNETALHIASKYGMYDAVSCLLDFGANPNLQDVKGRKPADVAGGAQKSLTESLLRRHHSELQSAPRGRCEYVEGRNARGSLAEAAEALQDLSLNTRSLDSTRQVPWSSTPDHDSVHSSSGDEIFAEDWVVVGQVVDDSKG